MIGRISRDFDGNLVAVDDRLWRTLCVNRDADGNTPSSTFRLAALHLLQAHSDSSI